MKITRKKRLRTVKSKLRKFVPSSLTFPYLSRVNSDLGKLKKIAIKYNNMKIYKLVSDKFRHKHNSVT